MHAEPLLRHRHSNFDEMNAEEKENNAFHFKYECTFQYECLFAFHTGKNVLMAIFSLYFYLLIWLSFILFCKL